MECELELWLKGYLFSSTPIQLPDHDDRMTGEENQEIREAIVRAQVMRIKALYHPQIDRCQRNYQISIRYPSKLNGLPISDDEETHEGCQEE